MSKKIRFGTATNTKKKAGEQGAENLDNFIKGKFGKTPSEMTKGEKKAFQKMAKELLDAKKISTDDYKAIVDALK